MKKISSFVVFAMMMVSTVWAYEPAPDTQAPEPHVAVVTAPAVPVAARPQLREGDTTTDGRLVGTPVAERRSTTEANNKQWIDGSIDVNVDGNVTLTPQTPQKRVEYRTRYRTRTRTRTIHVGVTADEAKGLIQADGDRVIGAVNDHNDGLIAGLKKAIGSDRQRIYDAITGFSDRLAGLTTGQWIIGLMVAVCIVMLIMVLRRLGNNAQAQAPTQPAPEPVQPATRRPTTTTTAPATTTPTTPAVTPAPPRVQTTTPAVDQTARDAAAAAMRVAKEVEQIAVTADEKASAAGRAGKWALGELIAEEDEEGKQILGELARLGIS